MQVNYAELISSLRVYANDGTDDLRNEAADAIEELQKDRVCRITEHDGVTELSVVPRWIPVTERLPDEKVCVLVWGGYFAKVMETAILDDGLFYSAWDNRTEMFGVTHWMPLPTPPREETE